MTIAAASCKTIPKTRPSSENYPLSKAAFHLEFDWLNDVADGINALCDEQGTGILQITHYQRILDYVEPDVVYIMLDGQVVMEGDADLAVKLEDKGYDWVRDEVYEWA